MHSFSITEIKAFVPAKDFSLSLAVYADMGFEARSNAGGIAYLGCNDCSFLLQDFYVESHAQNFMMHILVADVQAWYEKLDLPPSDVHFFGLKKGYVQIITSGLSSVLACGQRGAP